MRRKKGFTLMEILVAVSILTIVGGGILGLLISSQANFNLIRSRLELINETGHALNLISEWLMQAYTGSFNIGGSGNSIRYQLPFEQNNQVMLDAANEIRWGSSVLDGYYVIDAQNSQLIRHDFDSHDNERNRRILGNNITALNFSYANQKIGIDIEASETDWRGRTTRISLNSQVAPRN